MFKNATVYRLPAGWAPEVAEMEEALQREPFAPCSAQEDKSIGWAPPRGDAHGPLVESVGGQRILRLMIETRQVPTAVVRRLLEERLAEIEASTGRKPGRKESRDLFDDIQQSLLPQAFPKTASVWVWLDLRAGALWLDTASQAKADETITALVRALPGFAPRLLQTQTSPQAAMTAWLLVVDTEDGPAHLHIGRECELKSADEFQSVVRYTRHPLQTEEVRRHIAEGKLPTRLALEWEGRVAFTLTEGLALKKIAFLDGVFEDNASAEDEGGFDADVALATGELSGLLADLVQALGGEAAPVGAG